MASSDGASIEPTDPAWLNCSSVTVCGIQSPKLLALPGERIDGGREASGADRMLLHGVLLCAWDAFLVGNQGACRVGERAVGIERQSALA